MILKLLGILMTFLLNQTRCAVPDLPPPAQCPASAPYPAAPSGPTWQEYTNQDINLEIYSVGYGKKCNTEITQPPQPGAKIFNPLLARLKSKLAAPHKTNQFYTLPSTPAPFFTNWRNCLDPNPNTQVKYYVKTAALDYITAGDVNSTCYSDLRTAGFKSCCKSSIFDLAVGVNGSLKKSYSEWNSEHNKFSTIQAYFTDKVLDNIPRLKYLADRIKFKYSNSDPDPGLHQFASYYANKVEIFLNDYFDSQDYRDMATLFSSDYNSSATNERSKCYESIWKFRASTICKICKADNGKILATDNSRLKVTSGVCMAIVSDCAKTWRHMLQVNQGVKLFMIFLNEFLQTPLSTPLRLIPEDTDPYLEPGFDDISHKVLQTLSAVIQSGSSHKFDSDIKDICETFLKYDYDKNTPEERFFQGGNFNSWNTALSNPLARSLTILKANYVITNPALGSTFSANLTEKVAEAKAALVEGTSAVLTVSTLLSSYKKKLEKSKLNTIQATSHDDKILASKPMFREAIKYQNQVSYGLQKKVTFLKKIAFMKSQLSTADKAKFDEQISSDLATFEALVKEKFETGLEIFDPQEFARSELIKHLEARDAAILAQVEELKVAYQDLITLYNAKVAPNSVSIPTDQEVVDLKTKVNKYVTLFKKLDLEKKILKRQTFVDEWKAENPSAATCPSDDNCLNSKLTSLYAALQLRLEAAFVNGATPLVFTDPMKSNINNYSDFMSKEGDDLEKCNLDSNKINPTSTYKKTVGIYSFTKQAQGFITIDDQDGIELVIPEERPAYK